jgi:hypothetical protein
MKIIGTAKAADDAQTLADGNALEPSRRATSASNGKDSRTVARGMRRKERSRCMAAANTILREGGYRSAYSKT